MSLAVIKTGKQTANESTVGILERLLADAKNGEVETVFIIAFRPDGKYRSIASDSLDGIYKVGAAEMIKSDLLASMSA